MEFCYIKNKQKTIHSIIVDLPPLLSLIQFLWFICITKFTFYFTENGMNPPALLHIMCQKGEKKVQEKE